MGIERIIPPGGTGRKVFLVDKPNRRPASRWNQRLGRDWVFVSAVFVVLTLLCALSFGAEDRAESHFERASRLAQQGKLDEAESEYRLGLKISSSAEAYNNLGAIYFKKQHLREAIVAFKRAHRLEPDNSEFSFNLGLALYQAGESRAAIPYLTAGARSQDHVGDAHYLLGACYFELEKWQPSIDELELARKQGFESPERLFSLSTPTGMLVSPRNR
jgi:tetratricopeptide (TPR) repeat protein